MCMWGGGVVIEWRNGRVQRANTENDECIQTEIRLFHVPNKDYYQGCTKKKRASN